MAYKFKILGVDPSLNNFGMALVETTVYQNNFEFKVKRIELIRTSRKQSDFMRARAIASAFAYQTEFADIVVAELPSGAQSARASWALGIVLGIIACCNRPVVTVTPRQAKIATGKKNATKENVLAWAVAKFPETEWYTDPNGKPYKYNHHIADALAIVVAGTEIKGKEIINGATLS